METEKRQNKRYGVSFRPLSCSEMDCVSSEVTINDISTGGIGITTRGRLVKDQKVELEINLPDDDIPVFFVGEVAWVKKNGFGNDDPGRETIQSGIKILKMSKCDRERIILYIRDSYYI
jgi:hypothetical protein